MHPDSDAYLAGETARNHNAPLIHCGHIRRHSMSVEVVVAAAACLSALATAILAYLASKQLRADALDRLHERLISEDVQHALRRVFACNPNEFTDPENIDLRDVAEKVLNLYDLIGRRAQAGTVPHDAVIQTEWPTILRVAQQLGPYLEKERSVRMTPYKQGFQWLLERMRYDDSVAAWASQAGLGIHPHTGMPMVRVTPLHGYRNSRPCVAVFFCHEGHVLLLKRTREPHGWETPGGFLKHDEHPIEGARREASEETGFPGIEIGKLLTIQTGKYPCGENAHFHTLNVCYEAKLPGSLGATPAPELSHESADYAWVPIGLPNLAAKYPLAFPWIEDVYRTLS